MMVDLKLLLQLHARCEDRVRYGLGAKAPKLSAASHEIHKIDCSGYVRWLLYRASGGELVLPDGSWHQNKFAASRFRKIMRYRDVTYADPSRLFLAYLPPIPKIGHIWLVNRREHNGDVDVWTIESHGGHGANSRRWNYGVLKYATACYEIPTLK